MSTAQKKSRVILLLSMSSQEISDVINDSSKSVLKRVLNFADINKVSTHMKVNYSNIKSETIIISTTFRKLSTNIPQA